MKIYHVLPEWEPFSPFYGGAVAGTINDIMKLNSSHCVICAQADDMPEYDDGRVLVLPLFDLYGKTRGRGRLPLKVTAGVLRVIFGPIFKIASKNDVIWFHNVPSVAAALSAQFRRRGVKAVYHSHSSVRLPTAKQLPRMSADAIVFVSEDMHREAHGLYPASTRSHVLFNGVDISTFKPGTPCGGDSSGTPLILYVGRLHPEKGPHILIEAINILNSRGIATSCRIIGSPQFGNSNLTRYAAMLHKMAPSNVVFHGHQSHDHIVREFQNADIFCCPSLFREPFGKVIIEAMACGVPVIASNVGGIPEIARSGGVVLTEPGSAQELAVSIDMLIRDKQKRRCMSLEAVASARYHFSISSMERRLRMLAEEISGARSIRETSAASA